MDPVTVRGPRPLLCRLGLHKFNTFKKEDLFKIEVNRICLRCLDAMHSSERVKTCKQDGHAWSNWEAGPGWMETKHGNESTTVLSRWCQRCNDQELKTP